MFQVFYYSTEIFVGSGLTPENAKLSTIGIGAIMVGMTLVSIPLMDRTGRRTLHLYGLGGMFIFSIFITISFLIKVCSNAFKNISFFLNNKIYIIYIFENDRYLRWKKIPFLQCRETFFFATARNNITFFISLNV